MTENNYVLITAAYNEADHIGRTIESVLGQTLKPLKWVIVSDGSTDETDSIIRYYAERFSFIEFIRREKTDKADGFISKVMALKIGYSSLNGMPYRFIGILDADIALEPEYYKSIIALFQQNQMLGIAGGFVYEQRGGEFMNRPNNTIRSVAGAIQLFDRQCYEAIGGHRPCRFGGEDWLCEIMARMKGWKVCAFPDIVAYHYKTSSAKRGILKDALREGRMDYAFGTSPVFELFKCLARVRKKPYGVYAACRFAGYTLGYFTREERSVSKPIMKHLRKEQSDKIKQFISQLFNQMSHHKAKR